MSTITFQPQKTIKIFEYLTENLNFTRQIKQKRISYINIYLPFTPQAHTGCNYF